MRPSDASPSRHARRIWRRIGAAILVLLVLIGFAQMGFNMAWSLYRTLDDNPITIFDVARIETRIAQAYPGWLVEHVYTQYDGGLFLGKGASASAVIRWPGPQDFRYKLGFFYAPGDWTNPGTSLFANRTAASEFITAFKRRHPQPGLVVTVHGQGGRGETVASIMNAGPQGEIFEVSFWTGQEYSASNGSLGGSDPLGHLEYWRATETSTGIVWTLMPAGGS